jgi:hypothetical protein
MGIKSAVLLISNIRENLNEPLSSSDLLVSNAGSNFTNSYLLECLNKAKDREWDIVRQVREDYFQIAAASPISLVTTTKEYSFASDFFQLVGLKCSTSGWERLRFRQVDQSSKEFQELDAIPLGESSDTDEMIYDIIGQSKIKFATYPPATLALAYDYIQTLPDYTLSASSTSDLLDVQAEYREAYSTWKALGKMPSDTRLAFWSG